MTARTWDESLRGPNARRMPLSSVDFTPVASASLAMSAVDVMTKVRDAESQALDQGLVALLALEGVSLANLELGHWGSLADDRGQWSTLRVHGWAVYVVRTRWEPGGLHVRVEAGWLMYPPPSGPGDDETRRLWNEALYDSRGP